MPGLRRPGNKPSPSSRFQNHADAREESRTPQGYQSEKLTTVQAGRARTTGMEPHANILWRGRELKAGAHTINICYVTRDALRLFSFALLPRSLNHRLLPPSLLRTLNGELRPEQLVINHLASKICVVRLAHAVLPKSNLPSNLLLEMVRISGSTTLATHSRCLHMSFENRGISVLNTPAEICPFITLARNRGPPADIIDRTI